jgi:hypothetical protein
MSVSLGLSVNERKTPLIDETRLYSACERHMSLGSHGAGITCRDRSLSLVEQAVEQAPRVDRPQSSSLLRHSRLPACHSGAALGAMEANGSPAFNLDSVAANPQRATQEAIPGVKSLHLRALHARFRAHATDHR